jgi:hypothetical protein
VTVRGWLRTPSTWHRRPPERSPGLRGIPGRLGKGVQEGGLDTYSPQECEPAVKRKMDDSRLRLEAARFEAEKVVTRLLKDHEAWGHVSREGRQRGKAADDRSEPQEPGDAGLHAAASQQARFGHQLQDKGGAAPWEVEEERPRSSRSTREGRHTTSTPSGSDREQRLKEGFEEALGIKNSRLPSPAPRREVSPGRSSSRRMCPSPTESSGARTTATSTQHGGGGPRAGHPHPDRRSR